MHVVVFDDGIALGGPVAEKTLGGVFAGGVARKEGPGLLLVHPGWHRRLVGDWVEGDQEFRSRELVKDALRDDRSVGESRHGETVKDKLV